MNPRTGIRPILFALIFSVSMAVNAARGAEITFYAESQLSDLTSIPWVLGTFLFADLDDVDGSGVAITGLGSLDGLDPTLFAFTFGDLELSDYQSPGSSTQGYVVYSEVDGSTQPIRFFYDGAEWATGTLNFVRVEVENSSDSTAVALVTANLTAAGAADDAFFNEVMALTGGSGLVTWFVDSYDTINFFGRFEHTGTIVVSPAATTGYQREAFGDGVGPSAGGWSFASGGALSDAGEMGAGDHALSYVAGSVQGDNSFHVFHPRVGEPLNRAFAGNYNSVGIAGIQFRARHAGVGDAVVLRALLYDTFLDGSDWAQSVETVVITPDDTAWTTYTIPLSPAQMTSGGANGLSAVDILSDVVQIGLRQDPLGIGPEIPVPVTPGTNVLFDDITLYADTPLLPGETLAASSPTCFQWFTDAMGVTTATWEDWLFVGAPRECVSRDGVQVQDGAVYVFRLADGHYTLTQKIARTGTSVGGAGDRFGAGVVAAGGYLFTAAANDQQFDGLVDSRPQPDNPPFYFAGKVHVYRIDPTGEQWEFHQTLSAPVPGTGGAFGARSQARHIALNDAGDRVVIGEYNNFAESVGVVHVFRRQNDIWTFVETVPAPADFINFADEVVHLGGGYIMVSGLSLQETLVVPHAVVLAPLGNGLNPVPVQTINFEPVDIDICQWWQSYGGMAASGGSVAIAEPCATTVLGTNVGRVNLYTFDPDAPAPLNFEQAIEGAAPETILGGNWFGSGETIALDRNGQRLVVGSPIAAFESLSSTAGANALLYQKVPGLGWLLSEELVSPSSNPLPTYRMFGDTVAFAQGKVLVSESNGNSSSIRRGAVHVYDPDSDSDGVTDSADNCTQVVNPTQLDSNGDGFGNACDPDIAPATNDCLVNFADLSLMKDGFFSTPASPTWNPDADLDGNGSINFADLSLMKDAFFGAPGPSSLPNDCN